MTQVTIELDKNVAEQWNNLVRLFGNQRLLFSDFIEYHKKSIRREIARMQGDLLRYEDQYEMSSETFYRKFDQGELEDSQDFIVWSGTYEMQQESKNQLEQLSWYRAILPR